MTALLASIDDMLYGRAIAALGLTIVVFQLAVLVMGLKRQRNGRPPLPARLHLIAGVALAALPIAAAISVHAARALIFGVFSGASVDPSEKAADLSRGMAGQTSVIAFAVSTTILAAGLWAGGAASTFSKARSAGDPRLFPPALLVGLGLLPSAMGAVSWCTGTIHVFAGMAGMPPEQKGMVLEHHLDTARQELTSYASSGTVTILILAVIAVVMIVTRGRSGRAAAAPARPRSPRLAIALSGAAVALSALLVLTTRTIAAENQLPWPPTTGSQFVWPGGPPTPDLAGPDAPERAPVVTVFNDNVLLDGRKVDDFTDLELRLGTLRNNFQLLRPGADFNEMVLIEADAATATPQITSVLRAIRGAWYYRPLFAFTEKQVCLRPVFGRLERVVVTGARIRVAYTDDKDDEDADAAESWKNAQLLRLDDFADYRAFARRLVELRRANKPVLVKIARSPG